MYMSDIITLLVNTTLVEPNRTRRTNHPFSAVFYEYWPPLHMCEIPLERPPRAYITRVDNWPS